jgi:hypothetical protein
MPEQVEADWRILRRMIEDANRDRPAGKSGDHADLCDDFGAPRGSPSMRPLCSQSGHRAQLNFVDCLAYAIAKVADLPLLYKGDDFVHTDIAAAHRS